MKKIVVLDGSLHGKAGNTYGVTEELLKLLPGYFEIEHIELKDVADFGTLETVLRDAYGFIAATGTYWQSWGSPMQRFFEYATRWESTDVFLGKPLCCIVTMHSLGGMEVLGRLQSNFNLLGTSIPPQCSFVYSHVNQMAGTHADSKDVWDFDCLPSVAHNFQQALDNTHQYIAWEVDRGDAVSPLWLKKKKPSAMKRLFSKFWTGNQS